MTLLQKLNIGLVGAAGRGGTFRAAVEANGGRIHAICDLNREQLDRCSSSMGDAETFTDYREMLDKSPPDAVVIGTPQQLHVPQAILALERNIHVLSEVPAAVSIEQAMALESAARNSAATYMMAENYTYMRPNVLVRELVRQGLFGDLYYAEGEYLHELKGLAEVTTWRRHWQMGIDGVTYPTHSLGPILQWMAGDRVERVACEGTGRHYTDPRGEQYHQDSSVMLCKTVRGSLIKVRMDLVSERPHACSNYQLQGTTGAYESGRAPGERDRIWLKSLSKEVRWHDLEELMTLDALSERYLPALFRNPPPEALSAGHGGGDFYEVRDFVLAIRGEAPCPIGIHEALDMTLPGLVSQQSILRSGEWLNVPDSRTWAWPTANQLQMVLRDTAGPFEGSVHEGYLLRQYGPDDEAEYIRLMAAAGFTGWTGERIAAETARILPGGYFVIEHIDSGKLAATAVAEHKPAEMHPFAAELGWVAADPEHSGKGLGLAVCAAATRRMVDAGYHRIYLKTDDFRLAAIKIYLRLGYEPLLFCSGMNERWDAIGARLR